MCKIRKETWIRQISKTKMAAGGHIGFKIIKGLSLVPLYFYHFIIETKIVNKKSYTKDQNKPFDLSFYSIYHFKMADGGHIEKSM